MNDTIRRDDTADARPYEAPPAGWPPPPPPPPATDRRRERVRLSWGHYLAVGLVAVVATAATLGIAALVSPGGAGSGAAGSADAASPAPARAAVEPPIRLEPDDSLYTAIAEQVGPSVVRVDAATGAAGSGVVYSAGGYIVTNFHVVANSQDATLTLPDGERHDAEIVGGDPRSDLAVLRIDATDLPVPSFAEGTPEVGEITVAIGSPFGLDGSVTQGIVSALDRTVTTPDGRALVDMIQTDAAINPGNSGGALVNREGQVIGINTIIASTSGGSVGVGFAIPVQTVRAVADQLIETGTVEHAYLGVVGQTVSPDVAELYGLPTDSGAVIAEVAADSPAAAAGLQRGDIVVAVDGEPVDSMATFAAEVQRRQPGDDITLTVLRQSDELQLTATLSQRPDEPQP